MSKMTVDKRMSAEDILNEVRRQQWEMNSTRHKPDATLYISEDCWMTLAKELLPSGGYISAQHKGEVQGTLLGYTTVVVNDVEQYVELKENIGYGGRVGLGFDEWGDVE